MIVDVGMLRQEGGVEVATRMKLVARHSVGREDATVAG